MDDRSPGFCKFIGSVPSDLRKLMIPPAFTKEFGSIFSDTAYLTARGGSEYEVKLERRGRNVFFSSGWEKFVDFYKIKLEYFLVFDYQGSSRFNVGISDLSNCEIDYNEFHSQSLDLEEENDEDADEEEDDEDDDEEEDEEEEEEDDEDDDEEEEGEEDDESDEECMEMERRKGKEVMSETLEIAQQFPCRSPSFIVTMKSSYILRGRLWVPLVHGHTYLQEESTAKLRVGTERNARTWNVTVRSAPINVRFSAGWQKFVKDNRLRVDDVCKFELIDPKSPTYWVHIFRH